MVQVPAKEVSENVYLASSVLFPPWRSNHLITALRRKKRQADSRSDPYCRFSIVPEDQAAPPVALPPKPRMVEAASAHELAESVQIRPYRCEKLLGRVMGKHLHNAGFWSSFGSARSGCGAAAKRVTTVTICLHSTGCGAGGVQLPSKICQPGR